MRGETTAIDRLRAFEPFQSTPLIRGETSKANDLAGRIAISIHSPHARGDQEPRKDRKPGDISIRSPHARGDGELWHPYNQTQISIHSPHTRGDEEEEEEAPKPTKFQSTPLIRGETGQAHHRGGGQAISIRSPHTRGDSISLQKSIRIYVSLHNKTMIHRFSELYKPFFAAQSPIFGVRSPRKSHDSFTFARPSDGRGITP